MAVSVLTLISVPEGRVCCALALTAVSPKSKLANSMVRFIVVGFLVALLQREMPAHNCKLQLPQRDSRAAHQSCNPELDPCSERGRDERKAELCPRAPGK